MSKTKKIKGSAFTGEDGTFIFTPYYPVPEGEKNLKQVKSGRYSSLWVGKKAVSVRLVFDRKTIPPYQVWIEEMTQMYNALLNELDNNL